MRLHREVMVAFVGDIVDGRLQAGDALPREVTVAERFGISRGVARECLRGLEERGLVTVRHGSSTTVNPRERWELFDEFVIAAALAGANAPELLGEYLECRRVIEVQAAELAAERASEAAIALIEKRFAALVAATAVQPTRAREDAYHRADVGFHAAVVEATTNAPLAALVRRIDGALLAARYPPARPAYRAARALPEHAAILDAVRARDPLAAGTAMRAHLDTVEQYLREHAQRVARAA